MPGIILKSVKTKMHRTGLVIFTIISCVFVMARCMNNDTTEKNSLSEIKFADFAGPEKCISCHKEIYDTYIQTAHSLTAKPVEEKYFKGGSFEKGKNSFTYWPGLNVLMEKRDSGYYQVVNFKGEEKMAMRFDIITGSGTKGQSFLSWRGNKLFQLPITYYTAANQWSNSPGLRADKIVTDKPVTSRCLECHTTFAQAISGPPLEPMEFDHTKIILGVGCEKCHGPAAKHVEFQTNNPLEKTAKFIINPAALNRQLQLDVCALCHGSNIKKIKPSFQFTPGRNLADYFRIDSLSEVAVNNGNIDVHGNQYGLMEASKCFRMSKELTCNTCHNSHQNESGNIALFSQRCISCHNTEAPDFKTPSHIRVLGIDKNCINCHMPALPSKLIAVKLQGEKELRASLIRSHFISVYADETKKFMALQTTKKKKNK
jgi:nitrate/TMAO reductase-like tetraheme cytochrome c subunit